MGAIMANAPHRRDQAQSTTSSWVIAAAQPRDIPDAAINRPSSRARPVGCGFAAFKMKRRMPCWITEGWAVVRRMFGARRHDQVQRTERRCWSSASSFASSNLDDYVNTRSRQIGGHPTTTLQSSLLLVSLPAHPDAVVAAMVLGYAVYGRLRELDRHDSGWDSTTRFRFRPPAMAGRLMRLRPRCNWRCALR